MVNKEAIKEELLGNYKQFSNLITPLNENQFTFSSNGKWSSGQILDHLVKSVKPLSKVLGAKSYLKEKFGTIDRTPWSYEELVDNYKTKLAEGGKASGRFIPDQIEITQKQALLQELSDTINEITILLSDYSDEELNTLVIPHPLLGPLTVMEMMLFSCYHVQHHEAQVKQRLST